MKKFLLVILGLFALLPTFAQDFEYTYEGQTLTYTVESSENKTCVTKPGWFYEGIAYPGNRVSGKLILPDKVVYEGDTYTLVGIGNNGFPTCEISEIEFPSNLEFIGSYAFQDCEKLKSVILPPSVYIIFDCAFQRCTGLTSVIIPNSVTSIGDFAFSGCSGLTSAIIGNSVTSIGNDAFRFCYGLKKSAYPSSISNPFEIGLIISYNPEGSIIEDGWIYGPEKKEILFAPLNLEGEFTIPDSVTSIGNSAFRHCSGLTSVIIPNSVTSIVNYAFSGCTGLTSVIIPNSVTSIGYEAFGYCSGLTSVVIGNSVTSIGDYAFTLCSGLTSVIIPNSVTSIGDSAFGYCSGLTSAIIGNSVTSIGNDAFRFCYGLKKSAYPSSISNPFESGLTISYNPEGSIIEDGWIYGPEKKEIRFAPWNLEGEFTIPDSVTSIGDSAFDGCRGLTSVIIPNSVTSIGNNAFQGCSGLTEVSVDSETPPTISPDSWASFTYQTACLKIPAGSSCDYISSYWVDFKNMKCGEYLLSTLSDDVLQYRILPDPENRVAFVIKGDYSDLTEITIPERITDASDPANPVRYYVAGIASEAFSNLEKLKTVTFNKRSVITNIGSHAFNGCTGLTSLSIPESVTSIGNDAFYGCKGLTKAEFASIEALCKTTFGNMWSNPLFYATNLWIAGENITILTIPDSVEAIGSYAFSGGSTIATVSIPESVTSIGNDAFFGCFGLTKAEFASIEALCKTTFGNERSNPLYFATNLWIAGENITILTIPDSVEAIGSYAFSKGSKITTVSIPESVTSIGNDAFDGCFGLTKAEFASIEALCKTTFGNERSNPLYYAHNLWIAGENITILTIPDSVDAIGSYAFSGGWKIATVSIPESVTSIGNDAFNGCIGLTSAIIGNSVTSIGASAFQGCGLTSITIPNSVTSIEEKAFLACVRLTAVTIGNSLESINENVFQGADKIKSLAITDGTTPLTLSGKFPWNLETLYLGRPINVSFSSINNVTVGNLIESVDAAQFKDFTNLKSVTLGSGLKSIEDQAFSGCTGLTEIVIPYAVESIGESAFAGCSNLANIIMGSEVNSIANNAFNGTKATNVYITAQTPPTASNTTFSNYSGKLWLQDPGDESVMDAYYNAFNCWDRFDSYAMIQAESIEVQIPTITEGQRTIQLSAALTPENATLPNIFWSSSNPEVATVDCNGLVTLQPLKKGETRAADAGQCIITASTLYADGPIAQVTINNNISADIDIIPSARPNSISAIDFASPYDVYSINGVRIGNSIENLVKGIYVIRQGKTTSKIAVK